MTLLFLPKSPGCFSLQVEVNIRVPRAITTMLGPYMTEMWQVLLTSRRLSLNHPLWRSLALGWLDLVSAEENSDELNSLLISPL